jgi:opacity protein-like surface antigen
MILKSRVLLVAFAGLCFCLHTFAQDAGSSIAPTSGGGGEATPATPSGGAETAAPAATGAETGAAAGTTGAPQANGPTQAAPAAPVSISSGYGQPPLILQPGTGRFAEKPLKFLVNVGIGYDDNTLTTPDKIPPEPTPLPQITFQVPIPTPTPTPAPRPGQPKPKPTPVPKQQFKTVVIPTPTPIPLAPQIGKTGSLFAVGSVGAQWAFASPRTVFSLDLGVGETYYFSRPGDKKDYTGHLTLAFSRKLSPRLTLNAYLGSSYQSQPDFSILNAPTRAGGGSYLNSNAKVDLSYRWTARISTVTSYSLNSILYQNSNANNNVQQTVGEELNYQFSHRATIVGEYRMSANARTDKTQSTSSKFVLAGLDTNWTPRLRTTLRIGEEMRTFDVAGQSSTSPTVEFTTYYVYGKGSTLAWSSNYGLQQSSSILVKQTSVRTGIMVNHVFTARTTGIFSLNWNHVVTTDTDPLVPTAKEDDATLSLGLQYLLTSNLSFVLNYTYTRVLSNNEFGTYRRTQTSFGANYSF